MDRKHLACFLAIVMLLTMLPLQTFAADTGTVLVRVNDVSVGEKAPWTYSFTLDTTGILNITIGDCAPGWRYKLRYPDESESVWFSASKFSLGGPVQNLEITEPGTYSIALYAYDSASYSNVSGTVSATLTFTSADFEQEKEEWAVSDTVLNPGENVLTPEPNAITTIYEFCPEETGVYSFTANDSAALVGYWGPGTFLIKDTTKNKTNSLEWTITAVGQSALIGISGVETVTLTVEKTEDYVPNLIEWSAFENTEFENWSDYVIDTSTLEMIDVTDFQADVIVKCADGLYRYGSKTGRVVVANLKNIAYLNFGAAVEKNPMRVAYTDEDGNVTTGVDMTEALKQYYKAGIYPLTDELIYMLKELGDYKGWYDPDKENGYYLFTGSKVDAETAYLAFCGTVSEQSSNDTCTVTFLGDGTGYPEAVTVEPNTVITLPCRFLDLYNEGRVFTGFNTAADGSGKTYMDCTEYTVTGDVTLYAQWADIAIGDAALNSGEYVDNDGNVTTTQPVGGYAYFENGTLVLNNFAYTGEGYLFYHASDDNMTATAAVYYEMGDLNVVLEGENTLINPTKDGNALRAGQKLTITGSGSLTAHAAEACAAVITEGGIRLENVELLQPVGGSVQSNVYPDLTQYYIADADGNKASTVVIGMPGEEHTDVNPKNGRCDVCGEVLTPTLSQHSISLKGNIAIKYYMSLPEAVLADETAYMLFTMADGNTVRVPVSEGVETVYDGLTYYVFSCGVAAKEMADVVKSQFFYEGGSTGEYEYSVKQYADYLLGSSDDAELIDLVQKMLHYGAASQLHFGYNTDKPANADLQTPDYSEVSIEGYGAADSGTERVNFCAASLILKSETTLRFFFQADSSDLTVTHNGKTLEVKERGGLYYVDVTGISAKDLDNDVTVTVYDGIQSADVSYNPMTYCAAVLNDGSFSREMKDVVSALYLYNQAANVYLEEN